MLFIAKSGAQVRMELLEGCVLKVDGDEVLVRKVYPHANEALVMTRNGEEVTCFLSALQYAAQAILFRPGRPVRCRCSDFVPRNVN